MFYLKLSSLLSVLYLTSLVISQEENHVVLNEEQFLEQEVPAWKDMNSWMYCTWVKVDLSKNTDKKHHADLLSYMDNDDFLFRLTFELESSRLKFIIRNENGSGEQIWSDVKVHLADGNWNHMCYSWRASQNKWRYDLNGKIVKTGVLPEKLKLSPSATGKIVIGDHKYISEYTSKQRKQKVEEVEKSSEETSNSYKIEIKEPYLQKIGADEQEWMAQPHMTPSNKPSDIQPDVFFLRMVNFPQLSIIRKSEESSESKSDSDSSEDSKGSSELTVAGRNSSTDQILYFKVKGESSEESLEIKENYGSKIKRRMSRSEKSVPSASEKKQK